MAKLRAEIRRILGEAHTDEIENALVALHTGIVDPLKDDLQRYKADSDRLAEVQKKLDEANAENDKNKQLETKYNDLKTQYDALDKSVKDGKILSAKKDALKKLCETAGLSAKGIEKALKYADYSAYELGDDGTIKDAEKATEAVKTEWADYVQTRESKGMGNEQPPKGGGGDDKDTRGADIVSRYRSAQYGKKEE